MHVYIQNFCGMFMLGSVGWVSKDSEDDASMCVVFFTGGSGWNMEETMQKAAGWNMPLSPVVAIDWDRFTKLPLQHRSTFYWWVSCRLFCHICHTHTCQCERQTEGRSELIGALSS